MGSDPYSRGYKEALDYVLKGLDPQVRSPAHQSRMAHRVDGKGNREPEKDL